ncbi:dihydroneopterin aldolase [Planktotalea arctica]|uniref:dihydroneopterin aldolase n=1 Tax=Planktotalea arctica TaxID=1481893 RepID=UPI001FE626E0|nr:dihydroneopterin aldolase [Planktotalea arctica]
MSMKIDTKTGTETEHAFAHPEARALASAPDRPLDRISLRDHIVTVEIGAFQVERGITQRLSFNIVVEVRHISDDLGDDVDLILSYDRVTEAIDLELAAERLNLLETLAERIAVRILAEPQAERVFVRIEKLDRGGGALGVEIVRSIEDIQGDGPVSHKALAPRVLYLSEEALASENLTGWIDQLSALHAPLLIVVPATSLLPDQALGLPSQHRIALLGMEQTAWTLAGRDARCFVVGSRTELDWAIKNGQVSVWAPTKFVLDVPEGPTDLIGDPVRLAQWFAAQLAACEVLVIGEDLPQGGSVPARGIQIAQARI